MSWNLETTTTPHPNSSLSPQSPLHLFLFLQHEFYIGGYNKKGNMKKKAAWQCRWWRKSALVRVCVCVVLCSSTILRPIVWFDSLHFHLRLFLLSFWCAFDVARRFNCFLLLKRKQAPETSYQYYIIGLYEIPPLKNIAKPTLFARKKKKIYKKIVCWRVWVCVCAWVFAGHVKIHSTELRQT